MFALTYLGAYIFFNFVVKGTFYFGVWVLMAFGITLYVFMVAMIPASIYKFITKKTMPGFLILMWMLWFLIGYTGVKFIQISKKHHQRIECSCSNSDSGITIRGQCRDGHFYSSSHNVYGSCEAEKNSTIYSIETDLEFNCYCQNEIIADE